MDKAKARELRWVLKQAENPSLTRAKKRSLLYKYGAKADEFRGAPPTRRQGDGPDDAILNTDG
jgi:hypothetical protein